MIQSFCRNIWSPHCIYNIITTTGQELEMIYSELGMTWSNSGELKMNNGMTWSNICPEQYGDLDQRNYNARESDVRNLNHSALHVHNIKYNVIL